MALELYMIGLVVQDMGKLAIECQRLAIPAGSEKNTHVEVKMEGGLTFFLDSRPDRWDPGFVRKGEQGYTKASENYGSVLEFYLKTRNAVDAKYDELTSSGYQSRRAPYETPFGMCF